MNFFWGWMSRFCKQKRFLILLCTFGSSFLAFNYSLLSASTKTYLHSFSSKTKNDNEAIITVISHDKKDTQVDNPQTRKEVKSTTLQFKVPVSPSSPLSATLELSGRLVYNVVTENGISSSQHFRESTSQYNGSLLYDSVSQHEISKHAQKPFTTLPHRKVTNTNKLEILGDESNQTNKGNSLVGKSAVSFLSEIERNNINDNNNNNTKDISVRGNFREETNNHISHNFHFSKKITYGDRPIINNDYNNGKTDKKRQRTVASSKPSEITESSITSSNKNHNSISSISSDGIVAFSTLSSSIHPSIKQPSTSGLLSPANVSLPTFAKQLTFLHTIDGSSSNSSNHRPVSLPINSSSKSNFISPFNIPHCNTTFQLRRIQKRKKNLTVIENFIMGWKNVKCNESVTYTTHGDYRYLDNLVPLTDRWNGPVSVAIYCPGEDLDITLRIISYLKVCTSSNIDKWVTFHLIYDTKHMKKPVRNYAKLGDIPWLDSLYEQGKWKDCSQKPVLTKGNYTYRIQNGLLYPINIARNIARAAATTYFVLASDIELYPSINLIPSFLEMLGRLQKEEEEKNNYYNKRSRFTAAAAAVMAKIFLPGSSSTATNGNDGVDGTFKQWQDSAIKQNENEMQHHRLSDSRHSKHVFVLPVFEVKKEVMPCQVETKEQLASLLKHRAAVIFHHSICPQCHTFPKYDEWKLLYPNSDKAQIDYTKYKCSNNGSNSNNSATESQKSVGIMRIFYKAKRKYPYQLWEPIFIGTKYEPTYDERLSWEGLRDKMVSGYIMCAMDYDFYILDNAFLVHKPGIRKVNHLVTKTVMSQDRLINYRIRSELLKKFGKHEECAL